MTAIGIVLMLCTCTMQWIAMDSKGKLTFVGKIHIFKVNSRCLVPWVIYISLPPKCICEWGTNIFVFQILFAFRSRTPYPAPSEYFAFLFVLLVISCCRRLICVRICVLSIVYLSFLISYLFSPHSVFVFASYCIHAHCICDLQIICCRPCCVRIWVPL